VAARGEEASAAADNTVAAARGPLEATTLVHKIGAMAKDTGSRRTPWVGEVEEDGGEAAGATAVAATAAGEEVEAGTAATTLGDASAPEDKAENLSSMYLFFYIFFSSIKLCI
jgi:hypothetical protein